MINQNIMNIEMKADIFCDEHNFKWEKKHLSKKKAKKNVFFSNKPLNVKAEEKKNIKIVQQKNLKQVQQENYFSSL